MSNQWELPAELGINDDWQDAWISTKLADVMARRYFGLSLMSLSVEDRVWILGESEAFVARMEFIRRKREQQKPAPKRELVS